MIYIEKIISVQWLFLVYFLYLDWLDLKVKQ